jgi:hypothetical protein
MHVGCAIVVLKGGQAAAERQALPPFAATAP